MAFFAVVGHLRKESRSVPESQLFGIFDGLGQLVVAVHQQVLRNASRGGKQEEGHTAQLGIPIGVAAILLAREAFGGDVQAGVVAAIGLVELEDVVADALLGFGVALDGDVGFFPDGMPGLPVVFRQGIPSVGLGLSGHADGGLYQVGPLVVEGRGHDDILHQRHRVARLDVGPQAEAGHLALLDADGVVDGFLVVLVEVIGQGETNLRVFPSGLCPQVGTILADARINHIPYLFFRIFGVVVQVGLEQGEQRQAAGIVERGDAIADEAEIGVGHVDQMLDMHLQAVAARRSGLDIAVGDSVVHVEPAVEAVYVP